MDNGGVNQEDVWRVLKEVAKTSLPFVTTILLSSWGGLVHYLQEIKKKATAFAWRDLLFDLAISSFVGTLTYFACVYGKLDGWLSAILISISGHMGARGLAKFESLHDKYLR